MTWANPTAITYGTALGTKQLDATASVPGTFHAGRRRHFLHAGQSQTWSPSRPPTRPLPQRHRHGGDQRPEGDPDGDGG